MPTELDLRGLTCPLTWARAKVRLEPLSRGSKVMLLVDDAQSARDLPRAAEAAGYCVLAVEQEGDTWRLLLEV